MSQMDRSVHTLDRPSPLGLTVNNYIVNLEEYIDAMDYDIAVLSENLTHCMKAQCLIEFISQFDFKASDFTIDDIVTDFINMKEASLLEAYPEFEEYMKGATDDPNQG